MGMGMEMEMGMGMEMEMGMGMGMRKGMKIGMGMGSAAVRQSSTNRSLGTVRDLGV